MKKLLTLFLVIGVLGIYGQITEGELQIEADTTQQADTTIIVKQGSNSKYLSEKTESTQIQDSTTIKKVRFIIGYNLGVCYRGKENTYPSNYEPSFIFFNPFATIPNEVYPLNSIEFGLNYYNKNRLVETGLGFSIARVTSSYYVRNNLPDTFRINSFEVDDLPKLRFERMYRLYLYQGLAIYSNLLLGMEFIYGYVNGSEDYFRKVMGDKIASINIRRDLIGCGIYIKAFNKAKNLELRWFDPYAIIKISGAEEFYNSSPYKEFWPERLTLWYIGFYVGFDFK